MSNGMHSVVVIDPINTTPTQELGNDCSGDIKDEFSMGTGSNRRDSIAGSSSRSGTSITAEFDLLWRLRKYLVLLGVLAVSVTYNAGLTPPGGFWALNKDGHDAGDPVLHVFYAARFEVFFYCNATAFAASLVLVILLLSKSVTRHRIWLRSMQLTMILDLFSLLGAYAAGSCRAPKSSIYIWILVFAVFVYVGIHILISIRVIPETFSEKVETVVKGILSKCGVRDMQVRRSHLEKDVFPKALEKDVEDARKFILMLATFAAIITYQAGLNPPGGFWAENEHGSNKLQLALPPYKHTPATSVLRSKYLHRYNIFVSFNSTSFVASLVIIILLLSPELSWQGIRSKAVNVCVIADLLGLIVAYAAGCCRSLHTSFYVMLITVIVWICFALLAGAFVCKPGADWLKRIKDLNCVDTFGRIFSLDLGRNKPGNVAQDNSCSIGQHTSDLETNTPEEDNASEPEHGVPKIKEDESREEHHRADRQQTENIEEDVPSSEHHFVKGQHSGKLEDQFTDHQSVAKDAMPNTGHSSIQCQQATNTEDLEDQFTDHQSVAKDAMANTGHSSCQQATNTEGGVSSSENQSADKQQVANKMEQSSPTNEPASCTEVTNNLAVQKLPSDEIRSSEIELVETKTTIMPSENGNIGSNEGDPSQDINKENADGDPTPEHLKKTRTYILLLAILAVSLTYQSGLNPPGGFWSRTETNHTAGDPILEDTHHRRYIAFFYLNAVAFVASLVMLIMLLNKRMSNKVTKRFALQTAMIVDLLALTGAYVMGSSRKTSNSIYISLLVCLVLAYVAIHVLIATHVIPNEWKELVAQNIKHFWWPKSHQLGQNQTGDDGKDWERRRNLLLTLSVVAATVTYQAGMNPPGSVWSDDKEVSGTPGDPILQHNHSKRSDVPCDPSPSTLFHT
ncbi:hypothetical protein BRADI_1g43310v3 [Brachypodium distachyon]|uniref:PGG domain-containing protein n=1 Tax=Brachypodium distachyon TaxID=15368 RepID=A0A0Q3H6H2_BRADI|nr:hypothetical protein BRADI_1g43310v3 [Brachypodium distachyon]